MACSPENDPSRMRRLVEKVAKKNTPNDGRYTAKQIIAKLREAEAL
jgi:hypothetical protein